MEGGLFLNVVIWKSPAVFKLLASKDETLLIRGNSFLVLDLGLHVFNGVTWLNLKGDGFACEGLNKDLHTSSQPQNQVESGLFLDIVVREGSSILKLLASKNETLLIWGNSFLVLDLGFNILDGIAWLNLKGDGLPCEGLDKDLHSSSQTKNQMESWFFLYIVIWEGSTILKLLTSKDETLLIRGNAFLVLNLGLNIFNGVTGLNLKSDGLSCEGLDKDLHTSSQSEHQMKSGLFLDVVIRKSSAIFKLLACKDQPLLVWGNSFFVLNFCLHILNRVTGLNLKSDGLSCEGLDKNLHASSQSEHQMKSGFFLNVVIR